MSGDLLFDKWWNSEIQKGYIGNRTPRYIAELAWQAARATAEQSVPVAWMYKCWTTIHLHTSQIDHFYSIDNGESYVKGMPLYTAPQRRSELESIKSSAEWLITQPNGRSYTVTDKRKVGIALSCGYDVAAIESQWSGEGS